MEKESIALSIVFFHLAQIRPFFKLQSTLQKYKQSTKKLKSSRFNKLILKQIRLKRTSIM